MGFISRLITRKIKNAFDVMQSEASQKRLKEQDEKASKVLGMAQGVINMGPIASITGGFWREAGQQQVKQDIDFFVGKTFESLIADFDTFQGTVETLFGSYYYENRVGGAVGGFIGGGLGIIAGFFLPGGPLVWQGIFSWLGGFAGTFIQEFFESGPYDHPDVPGSPGELPQPDDPYGDLPAHAREYIDNLNATTSTRKRVYTPIPEEELLLERFWRSHYI